ncbi:hypothetical protein AB0M00_19585 [Streptomyces chartreusis]|uniref:hypothetical protein n=1 Tax=Streptomyces chartreusis TaxID=1969 RepID=UPI0034415CED
MDNPTEKTTYETALDVLTAHPHEADAFAAALDAIRAWRHLQPHSAAVDLAPLDAILDAAAVADDVPLRPGDRPTSLPEACAAHRVVIDARRAALNATQLVWDRIEAASIRAIDRHMPDPEGARL